MEDLLDFGKQVPASQPFSVLLGAELLGFTQGGAELKVPIRPNRPAVAEKLSFINFRRIRSVEIFGFLDYQ